MSILNGKKVKACVETVSDAEVLFAATECFV